MNPMNRQPQASGKPGLAGRSRAAALAVAALGLMINLAATSAVGAANTAQRPNLVFIIADDKYGDALEDAGFDRENAHFSSIMYRIQTSANCGRFRAIAWN